MRFPERARCEGRGREWNSECTSQDASRYASNHQKLGEKQTDPFSEFPGKFADFLNSYSWPLQL